jgi:hypothetical protein
VTTLGREILGHLRTANPTLSEVVPPKWLARARWKPEILVAAPSDGRLLAIDVVPSAAIPWTIYRQEVAGLLQRHKDLRVVVCVLEEGFSAHPEIKKECDGLGVGLKVLLPGLGLETVSQTDFDPKPRAAALPTEEGWFPSAILAAASGLRRFRFAPQIDRFIHELSATGHEQRTVFELVRSTIDGLLSQHPTFAPNIQQFMRLSRFETLFRLASPSSSEHVFHSFRVFLAGCPIIDQFHDVFRSAHERFCLGDRSNLSVEYTWLLASIFHDIGRPKEGAVQLADEGVQDEDEFMMPVVKDKHWLRLECQAARRALASLGAFVAKSPLSGNWDCGAIPDLQAQELEAAWTKLYGGVVRNHGVSESEGFVLRSHAVVGSMDFLTELFRTATASDETANRPFVVTHAVPAALAILLHDWRIWEDARTWKLFPINFSLMPMAALLIYLDTWDDYRRKGPDPQIFIRKYAVTARGASVTVEWGDSQSFEKEKLKYRKFKSAVRDKPFRLTIFSRMARPS